MLADLRFALRELRQAPGFAVAAILSLALGIGVNAAIFTLTNALFLRPLPVREPERLAQVETVDGLTRQTSTAFNRSPVSLANLRDFQASAKTMAGLAGFAPVGVTLAVDGASPKPVAAQLVTLNYFSVLGLRPAAGRFFPDGAPETNGAYPLAVLSHTLWTSEFHGDPAVVGRKVVLNASPYEVVGIAPAGFKGTTAIGDPQLLWIPLTQHRDLLSGLVEELFEQRRFRLFNVVGRLQPDASFAQADAELRTIMTRLEREYPLDNKGRTAAVSAVNAAALGIPRERLVLINTALLGAAGLVLLIACVNVANLLLTRAASRTRELGVRSAIGASRGRLLRQLLTESLLLAAAGGAVGLALAWWGKEKLWEFRPAFLQTGDIDLALDARVLAFAILCAVATGVLFGLAPAWRASAPDLNSLLRAGGRGNSASSGRLRGLLVAAEVAFCFIALTGAGLFISSMQRVQQVDPGFESRHLLAADFNLATLRVAPGAGVRLARQLVETARATPGVVDAAVTSARPLGGGGILGTYFKEGQRGELGERGLLAMMDSSTASIFPTLRIALKQGRLLNDFDQADTKPVAVVNEAFAAHMWPGENPLGKRFFRLRESIQREVVGVVANTARFALGEPPMPAAFMPVEQVYQPGLTLVVRTQGDPRAVLGPVLKQLQPQAPGLAFTNPATVDQMIATGLWAPRMGAALFGLFGLLGLALAAIGVHGVVSQGAIERTKEMGIRLALGAPPASVAGLILRQGLWPALAGIAAGALGAVGFGQLTASLLFETPPAEPRVLGLMGALLLVAALGAGLWPAARLARLNPVETLRE